MKKIMIFSIITSVILGIIITLFTGIFLNQGLLGANWWGYPFAWLTQAVLGPEYS